MVGLMWLIRGRRRGRDRAAFLDAAIISTGFAVVGGVFVIAPAAASGGKPSSARSWRVRIRSATCSYWQP